MKQHILITGAAGGIGAETARMSANLGYQVSLLTRKSSIDSANQIAGEINANGGKAHVVIADMSSEDEIVAAFKAAVKKFGAITALVNAAGIVKNAKVSDIDFESAALMMSVNVVGLMICCREATRIMSTQLGGLGGAIVNISSMAATIGGRPGASVYASSKGAVDVFTAGFAREVADAGIRVNTIRPGVITTNMTANLEANPTLKKSVEASIPMGRVGQPSEIAEAILWLLSPAASFVTGAHLNAGGGGFHVAASK